MEVSDRVVVMNEGRIEQTGKPRDLYEHPANEFVMRFIGAVNRLGDSFVRPHDLEITLEPNGNTKGAVVKRVLHLGFEVRIELVLQDGQEIWAQVSRNEIGRLDVEPGQAIYIRPSKEKVFG